jgi:hypothetical protein
LTALPGGSHNGCPHPGIAVLGIAVLGGRLAQR